MNNYYALFMAGGSGTRRWPLCRQNHPKQALTLAGEHTMFLGHLAWWRESPVMGENCLVGSGSERHHGIGHQHRQILLNLMIISRVWIRIKIDPYRDLILLVFEIQSDKIKINRTNGRMRELISFIFSKAAILEEVCMPRPIWKGHIGFGLVNIPVTLFSAEVKTDLDFTMLDSRDKARIRYQRVNDITGEEVPWDQIVKGYEFDEGQYVVLEDEDFEKARPEASEMIEVASFVKRDAIEDIFFDKPYILVPRAKGEKSYVLMRDTLKSQGLVGIASVVIRTREYLSALLPKGDTLYLILMRFAQELRDPDEFEIPHKSAKEYKITEKEKKLANQLVDAMTEEWDPSAHHDEYREALLKWINKRVEAGELESSPSAGEPEGKVETTEPIDISELLQRSVKSMSA